MKNKNSSIRDIGKGKRFDEYDFCRGIAITCIVLGHVSRQTEVVNYLYSFHVPVFFFLSGIFFNGKGDFLCFLRHKFSTLLIPFYIFEIVSILLYLLVEYRFRENVSILKSLIGMLYASPYNGYMNVNIPLWFLPALFSSQVIYYFISKFKSYLLKLVMLVGLFIIGLSLINYGIIQLPFCLNQAFIAVLFLGMGAMMKESGRKIEEWPLRWCYLGIALYLFFVIINWPFMRFDLESLKIVPVYFYLIAAFAGTGMLLFISRIVKSISYINYIGKNSLVIFALHGPVMRVVIYLTGKLMHCNIESIRTNFVYSIGITVIVLIVMVPVIEIYNQLQDKWKFRPKCICGKIL